jgi:hypothetical protein
MTINMLVLKEFEDFKGVIRIQISQKNKQDNGKRKSIKGQTTIFGIEMDTEYMF